MDSQVGRISSGCAGRFQPWEILQCVMGEPVLLQTEVSPVMSKLIEGVVDVTALHITFYLRSEP